MMLLTCQHCPLLEQPAACIHEKIKLYLFHRLNCFCISFQFEIYVFPTNLNFN